MTLMGLIDPARRGDEPQIYGGAPDVTGRLNRSATIAIIASPVGVVLISVTRLLIISNYNPTTASAIVSSGGYVDALLGTTIPLIPIFMPYLALALFFFNRFVLGVVAISTAVLISPAAMARRSILDLVQRDWIRITHATGLIIAVMILIALPLAGLLVAEFFGIGIHNFAKTAGVIACIAVLPLAFRVYPIPFSNRFYSDLLRQPWLPAETITLTNGQEFTGYVLSDDPSFIVVLSNDTRTIHYYPAGDVAGLQICQLGQASARRPLVTLVPAGTPAFSPTPLCGASLTAPAPTTRPTSPGTHARAPAVQVDLRVVHRSAQHPAGQWTGEGREE